MSKFMILDGNSIINRAYYGVRPLNAPDGTPTNAVFGFVNILQRLVDSYQPDALAVAFDVHAPTFRHEQFDGYKAKRKGMPEDLAVQMPVLKELLDTMQIHRYECAGYEADDILGTAGRICEAQGIECLIVTGDKDSFQLITDTTHIIHIKTRMGQTETTDYTRAVFCEEYGFEPPKMVDLKALMGDASDNIPGVPGIGEKTAMQLIQKFGSLEGVYENLESPEIKAGARKKLTEGRESAQMSYELATITRQVPLEISPADCAWSGFGEKDGLYALLKRLGFQKFIDRWNIQPAGEPVEETTFSGAGERVDLLTAGDVAAAVQAMKNGCSVWCTDLDLCVFSVPEGNAYVLCRETYTDAYEDALRQLFAAELPKTGHNIKDLQTKLLAYGIEPLGWRFDTALAAYLLDATASGYELDWLCQKYCGFDLTLSGQTEEQMSLLAESKDLAGDGMQNAAAVGQLEPALRQKLTEFQMDSLYFDVELPLCGVLAHMERAGVLIDRQALAQYGEELADTIELLQNRIYQLAGEEFNINSPKQLGNILFDKLMLPAGKKTKTGWSTNADVLEKLRGKHPIIQEVLNYRTVTKLKSTYADGLLKVISEDGRIHSNFTMTVTATGRLSSVEPNLQNIPVRKEEGSQIRRMFVAAPGNVLVDADYSQIELRLLAHISGDETMQNAFRNGEDIHAVTASQVFGVPLSEVTPAMRSHAKAVNFGIVYGISAFSLAQDIGVFQKEAKAYIDAYFAKYHGVQEYMTAIIEQAKRDGYVSTIFGRRRYLPELKVSNFNTRNFGERVARNMPIQGSAADIMKLAMVRVEQRLHAEGLSGKLILQVHDELIVECPEAEAAQTAELLKQEMEQVVQLQVPLTVDVHVGQNWMEAKA